METLERTSKQTSALYALACKELLDMKYITKDLISEKAKQHNINADHVTRILNLKPEPR